MANITTAANFSLGVFAEHTVVRNNNPIAVTDPLARQIHFVPFCANGTSVLQPLLDFEQSPMGIGEMEPGVIYVTTSTPFDFESPKTLLRINMRGYTPGPAPPTPTSVLDFPREAIFLNGFAAASPSVLFVCRLVVRVEMRT